jgi:hypothetical protein
MENRVVTKSIEISTPAKKVAALFGVLFPLNLS